MTDRDDLANELRQLRLDAGLPTSRIGPMLGRSQSWASKTDRGETLPDPDDVAAWCRVCGADRETRDRLVGLAERLNVEAVDVKRRLATGRVARQREIARLEAAASAVRAWQPAVVVGLCQTAGYAETVFRRGRKGGRVEPIGDVVAARLARQKILDDERKAFAFAIGEAALHRMTADVRGPQLARLVELSQRPNITVGVVPFTAPETVLQYHGYQVVGDPDRDPETVVLLETLTRSLTLRRTVEVADYLSHFAAVLEVAVVGDELRRFLAERFGG